MNKKLVFYHNKKYNLDQFIFSMVDISEIVSAVPGWMKWTGGSVVVVLILLIFIASQPGGDEVINAPKAVEEARENVTQLAIQAGADASEEAGTSIVKTFQDTGVAMAEQVEDPTTKKTIIGGMTIAGIFLALFVVLAIMGAILKALGFDVSWMK